MPNKYYHLITIGCAMNKADSERVATFLEKNNYLAKSDWLGVDLVILTTCGVRQSAEDRVYGLVNQIRKTNKKAAVVITGCLSKRQDVMRRLIGKVDLFMPINELPNIFELLKRTKPEQVLSLDEVRELGGEKYLAIIPKYESAYTAYVPIGNGCNNFCSYCVVPYARGREVYRAAEEIIAEVKSLVAKGYKEIVLIAQNVNSYASGDYNFPKLLRQLTETPGYFWLRFSSSHPKDMSDELIEVIGSSVKIANHLHLAVQSGDDKMLSAMNRKYTAEHYRNLITKIRAAKPGISITTDVIVGFPGETKKQFAASAKLFRDLKFEMAYVSQYSPRPGTVSWKMKDDVTRAEKKLRDQVLNEILAKTSLAANKKYLNKEVEVLVDGVNARGKFYGKTSSSKTVLITDKNKHQLEEVLGRFVKVKITKNQNFGLEGELV
ncbi:MAG: tRNA (N6-isopentenyl adenosine(37)-C2)-methylthiotransferase MiaB [Candidatus Falkowbacteria bacterium]